MIQTDHPSKIATARRIAGATQKVVWQNSWLAFAVQAVARAVSQDGDAF